MWSYEIIDEFCCVMYIKYINKFKNIYQHYFNSEYMTYWGIGGIPVSDFWIPELH